MVSLVLVLLCAVSVLMDERKKRASGIPDWMCMHP